MQKSGADILWECLVREGVEVIFGLPGGAIMPAYDVMLNYPFTMSSSATSRVLPIWPMVMRVPLARLAWQFLLRVLVPPT